MPAVHFGRIGQTSACLMKKCNGPIGIRMRDATHFRERAIAAKQRGHPIFYETDCTVCRSDRSFFTHQHVWPQ